MKVCEFLHHQPQSSMQALLKRASNEVCLKFPKGYCYELLSIVRSTQFHSSGWFVVKQAIGRITKKFKLRRIYELYRSAEDALPDPGRGEMSASRRRCPDTETRLQPCGPD